MRMILFFVAILVMSCKADTLSFEDYKRKEKLSNSDISYILDKEYDLAVKGISMLNEGDTASMNQAMYLSYEIDEWIDLIDDKEVTDLKLQKKKVKALEVVLLFKEKNSQVLKEIFENHD